MKTKLIVGLTGGIASGKTMVGELLKELGAKVIDSDSVARQFLSDRDIVQQLIVAFGIDIVDKHDNIITSKLRELAFASIASVQKINDIMWKPTLKAIEQQLQDAKGIVVVESALLFESGMDKMVDIVITISTLDDIRFKRVHDRDKTIQYLDIILSSQWTDELRESKANIVVHNNGSHDVLRQNITIIHQSLCSMLE
ncbi:MAG: dephospho-CoA kinase [Firmicutes bacterium]|nr:dephospho-CoA kinase [Bacillota bacterium]